MRHTTTKPTFKLICYRLSSFSRIRQQYVDYYSDLGQGNLGTMLMGLGLLGVLFFEVIGVYGRFGPVGSYICGIGFALSLVPLYPWYVLSRDAEPEELPYL